MPAVGIAVGIPFRRAVLIGGEWTPASSALQWITSLSAPSTGVDATANKLDLDLVDSNCVVLDGDYCTSPLGGNVTKVSFWFNAGEITSASSGQIIADFDVAEYIGLGATTANLTEELISIGSGAYRQGWTSAVDSISDGWHYCEIEWIDGTSGYKITLDGDVKPTTIFGTPVIIPATTCLIGRLSTGILPYAGSLAYFCVETTTDGVCHTFSGGLGMGTKEHDVSGNGNNGTWVTADLPTLRSGLQSEFHYNTFNGCSKVVAFDGTAAAELTTVIDYESAFTLSVSFKSDGTGQTGYLFYQGDGSSTGANNSIKLLFLSGDVKFSLGGAAILDTYGATDEYLDGEWHTAVFTANGSTYTFEIDSDGATAPIAYGTATGTQLPPAFGARIDGASGSYTAFYTGDIADVVCSDCFSVQSKDAYLVSGEVYLPDSAGTNDATGINVAEKYIPALADGTDDTEGLGLTNPPVTGDQAGNNSEVKYRQKAANTQFLSHSKWSLDGVNYDKKTWGELWAQSQVNFDNNVVACFTSPSVLKSIATWDIDYQWTPTAWTLATNYYTAQGCLGTSIEPILTFEGGYQLDVNGYISFNA